LSEFLYGAALAKVIKEVLAESGARAAVAFWGRDCDGWVTGSDIKIIANLRMGGTNPYALKKVAADVRSCDRLHAKVYIGAGKAVVASANASVNGLALEGAEVASWIEAGMVTSEVDDICRWFDELWAHGSQNITKHDWDKAEAAWNLRPRSRPTLPSFSDFDPVAPSLPLMTWVDEDTWTVNEDELEQQLGRADESARKRVDDGIGLSGPGDEKTLVNRWTLCWLKGAGPRSVKGKPWFTQTSDIVVRRGYTSHSTGIPRDVVLTPEQASPQPFDPSEKRFVTAFRSTLALPEYKRLHEPEVPGQPWFPERESLMRAFWSEVKSSYDKAPHTGL
jgi:hypothetical protein